METLNKLKLVASQKKQEKLFWFDFLSQNYVKTIIPTDLIEIGKPVEYNKKQFSLSIVKDLNSQIKNNPSDIFIFLTSALSILLSRYTSQKKVCIGTTIFNQKNINPINTILPIIFNLDINKTFNALLSYVKEILRECFKNQNFPLEIIKNELGLESDEKYFDVAILFNNQCIDDLRQVNPGIIFQFNYYDEILDLTILYNKNVYAEDTICRISGHLNFIMKQILSNLDINLCDIEILSKFESHQLLHTFNNTKADYPKDKTIVDLFKEQVNRTPRNVAIKYGIESISYRELDEMSEKIALYLIEKKSVKEGDLVGLLLEREINLIPCLFGILKSGCVYVPIDPNYPSDRINSIIENAGLKTLITRGKYLDSTINLSFGIIDLDKNLKAIYDQQLLPFKTKFSSSNLAYVIFTSGSTGNPKGVMIEHHSVVNRILWMQKIYPINQNDVILQKTPIVFDVSIWELFWWSFTGASLSLLGPDEEKDPSEIIENIKKNKVTTIHFVPSMLGGFLTVLDNEFDFNKLSSLRQVFSSGEALKPEQVNLFYKTLYKHNSTRLVNLYGPTEATVDVSFYECDFNTKYINVPLGVPIDNIQLFILDGNNNLQPIGIPGELCIAGIGLARGYLGDKKLTNEKFIENPFIPGEKLYKTGDLARWLPDGKIEYLGRIDYQVKIRGNRIELGEIENQLVLHDQVDESIVLALEKNGDKYLVAYYTSNKLIEVSDLNDFLSKKLPDYMIPSYFVHLESIPLTLNGKINRKALPDPEFNIEEYIAPTNEIEKKLVDIWSVVLGLERIGITDNFFSIGGDSIKAIQVSSRIRSVGYEVSVKEIVTNKTIKELSQKLKKSVIDSDQSTVIGEVNLAPIQKWFLEGPIKNKHHFNQSVILSFSAEVVSEDIIRSVFKKLQDHHDALRIVFKRESGIIQINLGLDLPVSLHVYDLHNDTNAEITLLDLCNKIQSKIDLSNGPLMRLGLFHLKGESRLLISVHHLVIDGVSWRILFDDLESLFLQISHNKPLTLPLKTDSYQVWTKLLLQYCNSKTFLEAKSYWLNILSKEVSPILRDNIHGENTYRSSRMESFRLSRAETKKLLTKTVIPFNSQINEIIITALLLSIYDKYNIGLIKIDLEGHGRENIITGVNINRTIGWFTSIFPVILEKKGSELSDVIKYVKETLRKIPNNGIDYLIGKYLTPNFPAKNLKNNSQISFNYLGQFDSDTAGKSYKLIDGYSGDLVFPEEFREYDWDINCFVIKEELEVSLTYSQAQYDKNTINTFMGLYKSSLLEIINYCCKYKKQELTPSDLTYKALTIKQLDNLQKQYLLKDVYPLSPMQEGMLFHSLYDNTSLSYNEQICVVIKGFININNIELSLNELIKRHDVLRTSFIHEGVNNPIQVLLKERQVDFKYINIVKTDIVDKNKYIEEYIIQDRNKSFNLLNDVLLRVSLIQYDDVEYKLIWSHHHIIMDGWSSGLIFKEFLQIYEGFTQNKNYTFQKQAQFCEYINWLMKYDIELSKKYWNEYLINYLENSNLTKSLSIANKRGKYNKKEFTININSEITNKIYNFVKENSVTASAFIQSIWACTLAIYSGKHDVVFGVVVSGRPEEIKNVETIVGLFINTIPLLVKIDDKITFTELIKNVFQTNIKSEPHHYLSLADIQDQSKFKNGLFDTIIAFENYPLDNTNEIYTSFEIQDVELFEQSNYDLNIVVYNQKELNIIFNYNSNVYNETKIKELADHILVLINNIVVRKHVLVKDLIVFNDESNVNILKEINHTQTPYPKGKSICEIFEENAIKNRDKIAVIYKDLYLTYCQLDLMSNQLAQHLTSQNVRKNELIGITSEKSLELIIGILGILKTGSAYVPINNDYPNKRKKLLVDDSNIQVLLTTKNELKSSKNRTVINLCNPDIYSQEEKFETLAKPNSPAYVIYTSGSTGYPKGVLVNHTNIIRLVVNNDFYKFNKNDRLIQTGAIEFDASTFEIWGPLLNSATLVLSDTENLLDSHLLKKELYKYDINILWLTSSLFNHHIDSNSNIFSSLNYILVGGEALSPNHIAKAKREFKNLNIINGYGPTENTTFSTTYSIDKVHEERIPIGKPISNSIVYIVDKNGNLLPPGISGELWVGGDGVATGYINNPELTHEKYIKNPFGEGILYKTGDLVKWMADGNIEFIGRSDQQVKINGFRIEPGEIESQINRIEGINNAIVVITESTRENKMIVCYYTSTKEISSTNIRGEIENILPEYMLPSNFIWLEKFPLTTNGKIDKNALPGPEISDEANFIAPSNNTEDMLVEIWSEILKIDRNLISVNKSFFELGGHSLNSMILKSRIKSKINFELRLSDIFKFQTIKEISDFIRTTKNINFQEVIKKCEKKEYYKLSSSQLSFYFSQFVSEYNINDNIYEVLKFQGIPAIERITNAIEKLIFRHEVLRTAFTLVNDTPVQIIKDNISFKINIIENKRSNEIPSLIKKLIKPFDLHNPPLIRVTIIIVENNNFFLIFDMHHIVVDIISYKILIDEFCLLYKNISLTNPLMQYRDYSEWDNNSNNIQRKKDAEKYWLNRFSGNIPKIDLPKDFEKNQIETPIGAEIEYNLNRLTFNKIKFLITKEEVTSYVFFLSIINVFLSKITGGIEDVIIGAPVTGRDFIELEKTIGTFLNTIALRNYPFNNLTFREFLQRVKKSTLEAFNYKDYAFEKLINKLFTDRSNESKLFNVRFVHQLALEEEFLNNFDESLVSMPFEHESTSLREDLSIYFIEQKDYFAFKLNYNSGLFKEKTISRFVENIKQILDIVLINPDIKINDILLNYNLENVQINIKEDELSF